MLMWVVVGRPSHIVRLYKVQSDAFSKLVLNLDKFYCVCFKYVLILSYFVNTN